MMLVALVQIQKRLSSAQNMFENRRKISPQIILSHISRCPFADVPFLKLFNDKITVLKNQYRNFILGDWKNEEIFKAEKIPVNDTEKFWGSVLQHPFFKDLAQYAVTCLITPVSNAVIEKSFSLLTAVKTKQMNRIETELLEAIISIRTDKLLKERCCKDLLVSENVLARYKFDIVYKQINSCCIDDTM